MPMVASFGSSWRILRNTEVFGVMHGDGEVPFAWAATSLDAREGVCESQLLLWQTGLITC